MTPRLTLREQLVSVSDVYCAATGRARGTVSAIVVNRGSTLDRIADGEGDITTRVHEKAMAWFAANWPDAVAWPDGIERPAPAQVAR